VHSHLSPKWMASLVSEYIYIYVCVCVCVMQVRREKKKEAKRKSIKVIGWHVKVLV